MDAEVAFLTGYALVLVAISLALEALGRRSTDPWSSRVLAASRPPDHEQRDDAHSWPHAEVPTFHLGLSAVALAAAGDWTRENWAVAGHKVAICNEDNFSDGELFVETWKAMKIGPVVGKRTGGGEVGSGGGYPLVDGGSIYIPNYGAFDDGKWIIEGVGATPDIETWLKEIVWREFSHHLLWHRPEMPDVPLRREFEAFPFEPDARLLRAWQRGRTGYPIVDAGLRQLWQTGWMHNRVRMIVGSALVKQLLQPWQDGAAWFWDTLVDADLASNSASWQWIAGCGVDAAPYFRVFNPTLQGEKFDPDGRYTRRWVPELKQLPDRWLHRPWEAPEPALAKAGLRLDLDYPRPLVTPAAGRAGQGMSSSLPWVRRPSRSS